MAGSASAASSTALAAPAQKAGPAPSAKQPCTQAATKRLGSNARQRPGVAVIRLKARRKMRWGVPASRCAKARASRASCRAGRSAREAACQAAAASPRASKSDPPWSAARAKQAQGRASAPARAAASASALARRKSMGVEIKDLGLVGATGTKGKILLKPL